MINNQHPDVLNTLIYLDVNVGLIHLDIWGFLYIIEN
jgi:hypothetical protein